MKWWLMLSWAAWLTACAAPSESSLADTKQRALAELAELHRQSTPITEALTVHHSDELFVELPAADLAEQPGYLSAPVTVSAQQVAVRDLLQDSLLGQAVGVWFTEPKLADERVSIHYQGDIAGLLRRLGQNSNWFIDTEAERVVISRWQTAEFDVAFIAGASEFFMGNRDQRQGQQQRQAGEAATAAVASSDQFSNFSNNQHNVWEDLRIALGLLLSAEGQLQINQSSTSVLVKDTPHHVAQVEHYLQQQNERLTRQVAIEVQIIEVSFNDEQQHAVNWQALAESAGGNTLFGMTGGALGNAAEALGGQLFWQRQTGRMSGSEVFLQALEQQGLVRINNQPRVLSLNNQIAKIALQDNATYLASSGTTNTVNVGATSTLQPGVVTTGFELYVLPSIRHGEVILQLSTELSDLQRIDEVRSGDQLIQTPHTNRKQFFMQAVVGDGQTLLLSGLRNEREQQQQQQSWVSWLLGGEQLNQQRQSETLVLLTPTIIHRESN